MQSPVSIRPVHLSCNAPFRQRQTSILDVTSVLYQMRQMVVAILPAHDIIESDCCKRLMHIRMNPSVRAISCVYRDMMQKHHTHIAPFPRTTSHSCALSPPPWSFTQTELGLSRHTMQSSLYFMISVSSVPLSSDSSSRALGLTEMAHPSVYTLSGLS